MTTDGLRKSGVFPAWLAAGAAGILFAMPRLGAPATLFGCAFLLSAVFAMNPERLRSRGGSMLPAYGLLAFMWLNAAVISALSLLGKIE